MKKAVIKILLLTSALVLVSAVAHAYQIDPSFAPGNDPFAKVIGENPGQISGAESKDGSLGLVIILQIIAGALLYFAAPIAILMLIFAAIGMIAGGSDPEKVEQSKKHITWIVLGLLLIILSYSVVRAVIGLTFGAAQLSAPPTSETSGDTGSGGTPKPTPGT